MSDLKNIINKWCNLTVKRMRKKFKQAKPLSFPLDPSGKFVERGAPIKNKNIHAD